MDDQPQRFEISRIKQSFDRAADTYHDAAVLQHEIGRRLLEALEPVKLDANMVLDAGCGTGEALRALQQRFKSAHVISLDVSENMLQHVRSKGSLWRKPDVVCAEIEQLPFADNSIDLVFSNLAIQWVNDLPSALAELYRVLAPGGLLMFSTFGPDTLMELRRSWQSVDQAVHVNSFIDMHDIGDMLLQAGMSDPVMSAEKLVVQYQQAQMLMQDLRDIGANITAQGHRLGLLTPASLRKVYAAYEQFRTDDGLPASYEVVYGHAWKPDIKLHARQDKVKVDLIP